MWGLNLSLFGMLSNVIYSGMHKNATTAECVCHHEVEMESDAARRKRFTRI